MSYQAQGYDVAVIGAGHAGIEAALASARLGCSTIIFTINMDAVGNCPCNPAIGGTAKGHLVYEIDALGGEMGRAADHAAIQCRMLNRSKGPAVQSLRMQVDRRRYSDYMKHTLEKQPSLFVKQAEIIAIEKDGEDWLLTTHLGAIHRVRCVVIATGTFLGGRIYIGDVNYAGGPDGMFPATRLAESLKGLNISLRRFKTGTPARVLRSSIDYTNLECQNGDEPPVCFSADTETPPRNEVQCYVSWTNERTKQVIMDNIHRSPLYGGVIEGVGPRYCPSIEDKVMRFPTKERHQCFVEPCGLNTEEIYLQGISSSLPEDVQIALYKTMDGLKDVHIIRPAYAIEYDCVDPTELQPTMEFKAHRGLFGAGQFNGSSGYEEAAAQGLVAGINAAHSVLGREPLVLERSSSYIGTLIDDLVTKGVNEPYRMMTSRTEYRLILRQDNAARRLTPIGYRIGLVTQERYDKLLRFEQQLADELKRVKSTSLPASEEVNAAIVSRETSPITGGVRIVELLKRPQLDYAALEAVDYTRPDLPKAVFDAAEIEIKYEGYIERQLAEVRKMRKLEERILPDDVDYTFVDGLRLEAREKLNRIRPRSIGQASRITGISPADISVLMIWLSKRERG
ncbi:MAG: tRNA uridine-5-carboxymethylaminomethyl(34) synthesis enzyme MnmG [Ruminococcaceae bacterium]|nr:tRNA uridine-5-carboxymethylaminomethyl(34) synthesis enzyme MnmG [Oscillospiraceae bacterium]